MNEKMFSPTGGKSSETMQVGDKELFCCTQTDLSRECVFSQHQSVMKSDSNTRTVVLSPDKLSSVELKEELNVEDLLMYERQEEDIKVPSVTGPSASAGEDNRQVLPPVAGNFSSSGSVASLQHIPEIKSKVHISKFTSGNVYVPSSVAPAKTSPPMPDVPTQQSDDEVRDPSCVVQAELAEQSFCVKKEPVVKSECEDTVAVLCSENESVLEPMHEVWVQDMQSWEKEDEMVEADLGGIHQTTCWEIPTRDDNEPAVSSISSFDVLPSTCMAAQSNPAELSVQVVKAEEPEMNERHMEQECKSEDNDDGGTISKMLESEPQGAIKVEESRVKKEDDVDEVQWIMAGAVEKPLEDDSTVEQNEGVEGATPRSGCISKTLGKKSHKCSKCPDIFHNVDRLHVHLKEIHGTDHSIHCEVCKTSFADSSHLTRHMKKHTGEQPFQCDVCGKSFREGSYLNAHMRKHTGECPFQCELCKVSFSDRSNLTRHMRTHTGERPFQCNLCEMSFGGRSNLLTHMRTHTGERPFQCDLCQMSFTHSSNLSRHRRKHTGERPFQCNICKMSYSERAHLTTHLRTHTGERPFKCNVCERSFNQSSCLTTHMRTHTGERPFRCDVCEKSFSQSSYLTTHMRTHTGERPFKCDLCKMSFTSRSSLTTHIRTHTGERPFRCDVCEKTFSQSSCLNTHMRTHTGERPFQCNVCKMSFSHSGALSKHAKSHCLVPL